MKRSFLYILLSGSTALCISLILTCQPQIHDTGKFSSLQQEELRRISWMIWNKKPENEILELWETFVEREKKNNLDFQKAIETIFEGVKNIADKNIQFAQEKIRQAEILKLQVDEEMENVHNHRIQFEKSKRIKPFNQRKFEFNGEYSRSANLKKDENISNLKELAEYEASIQWMGMEASLQGTGGVALLEYAKDAIQTAISNISGVGTTMKKMRCIVERKMSS